MAKVQENSLSDIMSSLPEMKPFNPGSLPKDKIDQLFLCALGFEPRCLTIPSILYQNDYKAAKCLYVKYRTNVSENDINLPKLQSLLEDISGKNILKPLEVDLNDFSDQLKEIIKSLSSRADELPSVTVDISVFANRLIMRSLKVLIESDVNLRVVYSEANVYHPTKEEYQKEPSKWKDENALGLERGVNDVAISIDHPGQHMDILPNCIIIFPCYNAERSKAIIAKVDPSLLTSPKDKLLWVLGKPHMSEDSWREDVMREINNIPDNQPQHSLSTFAYKDSIKVLDHIHSNIWDKCNITLAPNGSKMQALGAALFCYLHPDVRVMFATPNEYNAMQYTEGCKDTWMIDFGDTKQLRSLLDTVGQITIQK